MSFHCFKEGGAFSVFSQIVIASSAGKLKWIVYTTFIFALSSASFCKHGAGEVRVLCLDCTIKRISRYCDVFCILKETGVFEAISMAHIVL